MWVCAEQILRLLVIILSKYLCEVISTTYSFRICYIFSFYFRPFPTATRTSFDSKRLVQKLGLVIRTWLDVQHSSIWRFASSLEIVDVCFWEYVVVSLVVITLKAYTLFCLDLGCNNNIRI